MIQALRLKVIIEPDVKRTETDSGLYVGNEQIDGRLVKGTIHSIGSQVVGLKAGDKVCYDPLSGVQFEFDGKKYVNMYFTEVLANV